jgi:hypothetical protein
MKTLKSSTLMRATAAFFVMSTFTVGSAHATTYDAASGFSSSNPSGPWSYGTGTAGTSSFTLMSHYTGTNCEGLSGFACWQPASISFGVPLVAVNKSSATIDFSTAVYPTGLMVLHPGPSTDTIVDWIAPSAGTYTITGFFELLDISPTGVIGSVYNGSTQLFSGALTGPAAADPNTVGGVETFSITQTLAAGSVLSFAVNNDGNYLNDSTGFDAIITTASPEPAPVALFAAGFIAIALFRRRTFKRLS